MIFPKVIRLLFSIVIVVSGWLMIGVGYATPLEGQLNTVLFCLGLLLFMIGAGEFASTLSSSSNEVDSTTGQRILSADERKFGLYLTILRFLTFKVTDNLKRIYLDFEIDPNNMILTAFYEVNPSELELRLLDEIVIKASSHIQDYSIENKSKLMQELSTDEKHDFTVFAVYSQL